MATLSKLLPSILVVLPTSHWQHPRSHTILLPRTLAMQNWTTHWVPCGEAAVGAPHGSCRWAPREKLSLNHSYSSLLRSNKKNCLCESIFYHALDIRRDGCLGVLLVLLIVKWEKTLVIIKAVMISRSILWHENFLEPEKPVSIMDQTAPAQGGVYSPHWEIFHGGNGAGTQIFLSDASLQSLVANDRATSYVVVGLHPWLSALVGWTFNVHRQVTTSPVVV